MSTVLTGQPSGESHGDDVSMPPEYKKIFLIFTRSEGSFPAHRSLQIGKVVHIIPQRTVAAAHRPIAPYLGKSEIRTTRGDAER